MAEGRAQTAIAGFSNVKSQLSNFAAELRLNETIAKSKAFVSKLALTSK